MKTKFLSGLAETLRFYMDNDADWYSYLWNKLGNPGEGNDSRNYSASQEFASCEGFWIKMCRWDGGEVTIPDSSHPQSRRSKPTRDGMRAAAEQWRGWRNTFRPVITAPRQESIKREEDPPRWHLESLRAAALMNQTVSGLNTPVFWRLSGMLRMSEIIEALCREKDTQQIWSAAKMWRCLAWRPPSSRQIKGSDSVFPHGQHTQRGGFLFCTRCNNVYPPEGITGNVNIVCSLCVLHSISVISVQLTLNSWVCKKAPGWSTCDMQARKRIK